MKANTMIHDNEFYMDCVDEYLSQIRQLKDGNASGKECARLKRLLYEASIYELEHPMRPRALRELAHHFHECGDLDSAVLWCDRYLERALAYGCPIDKAAARQLRGMFGGIEQDFGKAEAELMSAKKITDNLSADELCNNPLLPVKILHNLGSLYRDTHRMEEALDSYMQVINYSCYEFADGMDGLAFSSIQAYAAAKIARIYMEDDLFDDAYYYLTLSFKTIKGLVSVFPDMYEEDLADSHKDFADFYKKKNVYDKAKEHYWVALGIYRKLFEEHGNLSILTCMLDCYLCLGDILFTHHRMKEAEDAYKQFLYLYKKLPSSLLVDWKIEAAICHIRLVETEALSINPDYSYVETEYRSCDKLLAQIAYETPGKNACLAGRLYMRMGEACCMVANICPPSQLDKVSRNQVREFLSLAVDCFSSGRKVFAFLGRQNPKYLEDYADCSRKIGDLMAQLGDDSDEAIAEYLEAISKYRWIADVGFAMYSIYISEVYEKLSKLYSQVGCPSEAAEAHILAEAAEAEWEHRMDKEISDF